MNNIYDYDQVRIVLNENRVIDSRNADTEELDLSFKFGTLSSKLPVIFFYESDEYDERVEKACEDAGVLTCGAVGSKIPLLRPQDVQHTVNSVCPASTYLYEVLDPTTNEHQTNVEKIVHKGFQIVVGCSVSKHHGLLFANKFEQQTAVLVGPTQTETFKNIDTLGMMTPRVSMVQDLICRTDAKIFVTVGSSAEACKAFVAGADAVVLNVGGPFLDSDMDVKFLFDTVAQSLRGNIERLCKLASASKLSHLPVRCSLVPVQVTAK